MAQSKSRFVAVLSTLLLMAISSVAMSGQQWFLMARHGECMEIERLKRKVPDLAEVNDPYSFVQFMRQKGLAVTFTEMAPAKGKAVEVKVPEKELSLVFVSPELCQSFGAR
jgi:hypothetical protein